MRFKIRVPKLTIYMKLVLTFLCVLTPLYALSLSMNYSGSASVREEISKSMSSKVDFYMDSLETEFRRILGLEMEYLNDDDLNKLSITPDALFDIEQMQAIRRVTTRLRLLKTSSTYIGNASVHIPGLNRTITVSSDSRDFYNSILQEEYNGLLKSKRQDASPFMMWNGRLFIMVSSPYPDSVFVQRSKTNFMIAVEISKERIAQALLKFIGNGQGGALLISHDGDWSVSSSRDDAIPEPFKKTSAEGDRTSKGASVIGNIQIGNETYLYTSKASALLGMTLVTYVPEREALGPIKKYNLWYWVLSFASIFIVVFFSYLIFRMIHQPLKTLLWAFKKVELGNLRVSLKYSFADEFKYLYNQFNDMVEKLNVMVHEVYEQKYRARSSELRQLQSQINPHFLYNSFFILYRMAKIQDYDNVLRFTKYLGEYFQFITKDGSDFVPLETEARFARTYAEIQTIRFSNRIRVEFGDIPESCRQVKVPRLILQPIIENAFNHGLEHKLADGLIEIAFMVLGEHLLITVEDNGERLTDEVLAEMSRTLELPAAAAGSTGVINVHRRIQIKYGADWGLNCSRGELGGLRVAMKIPMAGGEEDVATFDRG